MAERRRIAPRTLRLPSDLDERLAQIAQEEGRSDNNLILCVLRRWLEHRNRDKGESLMPYIDQEARKRLTACPHRATTPGELNYLLTNLVLDFIGEQGGMSYTNANAAIGALECAKLELYRRMVAPYEDTKIEQNGDVYPVA